MSVAGNWNVTVKSPLGAQSGTFTVTPTGDAFDGVLDSQYGRFETLNGRIDGNRLTWRMVVKMPLSMTLDCEALVSGDNLGGKVSAGLFGTMALSGTRA
jgi:hypothetical protein